MSSSSFDLMWDWWLFVGRFLIFCKFNSSDSSSKPCSNSYHLIIQCLCINMVDEIAKSPQLNRCISDTLTSPTKWTTITAKLQAERFGLGVTRHVRSEEKNRGNKIKPQSFMIFFRKIKLTAVPANVSRLIDQVAALTVENMSLFLSWCRNRAHESKQKQWRFLNSSRAVIVKMSMNQPPETFRCLYWCFSW